MSRPIQPRSTTLVLAAGALALLASTGCGTRDRESERGAPAGSSPAGATAATPASPLMAARALAAVDRAYSDSSAQGDLVTGITRMLATDAVMPVGAGGFAEGPAGIAAALRADSLNATSRATWTTVRAGISADGTQGFTLGLLNVTRADGTSLPWKYLAYWERRAEGWRVVAFKRARRAVGAVDTTQWLPVLPAGQVAPTTDAAIIDAHRASLAQAERDFSRDAQVLGLGPAFAQYGEEGAMHLGGPHDVDFIVGLEAIARSVGAGLPPRTSPVTWAPDHRVIVASSGDLGVTVGHIVVKPERGGAPARLPIPFFTVWHRAAPTAPWRYVAE
ncbi:MAG: nuclear transport factor 2 family protein [Gemmatimonadota bacterium]|nr:nuclear transport factor 2 family protein [Gemmatimonadota bacterium]